MAIRAEQQLAYQRAVTQSNRADIVNIPIFVCNVYNMTTKKLIQVRDSEDLTTFPGLETLENWKKYAIY